jgi:hypothetical protein
MSAYNMNISVARGDDIPLTLTFYDGANVIKDLTGYTVEFTARESCTLKDANNGTAKIFKTSLNLYEIEVAVPTTGVAVVYLRKTDLDTV